MSELVRSRGEKQSLCCGGDRLTEKSNRVKINFFTKHNVWIKRIV